MPCVIHVGVDDGLLRRLLKVSRSGGWSAGNFLYQKFATLSCPGEDQLVVVRRAESNSSKVSWFHVGVVMRAVFSFSKSNQDAFLLYVDGSPRREFQNISICCWDGGLVILVVVFPWRLA